MPGALEVFLNIWKTKQFLSNSETCKQEAGEAPSSTQICNCELSALVVYSDTHTHPTLKKKVLHTEKK